MSKQVAELSPAQLFSRYVLTNNLTGFTDRQRANLISHLCKAWKLDFNQQPFIIINTQGKEKLYLSKAGSEQVRDRNKVSINQVDTKIEGDMVIVTAQATLPSGRQDSDVGVVSVKGLSGENLSNAMLKAVTKAKRRVTLSICGLPVSDVVEADHAGPPPENGGSTAELNQLVRETKPKQEPKKTESEKISEKVLSSLKDNVVQDVENEGTSSSRRVRASNLSKAQILVQIEELQAGPGNPRDAAEVARLKALL